jgi:hypothetical protein
LAPTWRLGDIVIMDNLAAHKVAGVRQAVEACGAELRYLAALQSRPQSDRKRLRQVQGACAQVACPHPPLRRARFCSLPVAFARSLRKNIGGFEGMGRRHRETNRCADCGRRQDLGQGYQECRRVAERRSRGNCPAQDLAGTPILLSKSWRRRSKQRQTMALAGNCAAPFTLARFARVGTSHRRAECSSDSPPKNLGRRPKMWSRGVGN